MPHELQFNAELIKRYDKSGPRYTSYPTAVQFNGSFSPQDYRAQIERSNARGNPLSLYFHIPFCDTICYYCGCNKVVTKDHTRAAPYLERLYQELAQQALLFDSHRKVDQLHWGGGTPTFISHDEMRRLMDETRRQFHLHDDDQGEYSIEIDPRSVSSRTVMLLRELGFNRMSLGVQDFEPVVQQAVNRIQTEQETLAVLEAARDAGFKSISVDLIYGLPHQTPKSFARTLDRIITIAPQRLSVFNYAHLPELFKPQRRINPADLPTPGDKLTILHQSIQQLSEAGYVYIGMDHFARPDDELAIAQREGTLYRNFQGYSTHSDCDLIGLGTTAIGQVADCYAQNAKSLNDYMQRIDAGELAVNRGVVLNQDDILRRDVITRLICHFALDYSVIEQDYGIQFRDYFAESLQALEPMQADGLLIMTDSGIEVLPVGKLMIRNICMEFDAYLKREPAQRYSKVL